MSDWLTKATVGGFIRLLEGAISATPTLLVGLLIAAVLRYYLGKEGTRKLFGGDSLRSLPQSWAVGMLLPVCSIGVLPILFEMRRCRIKPGAMSAFALAAPLFNPLSLLYGLTLARPYVILFFAFGSLIVVTLVGVVWDRRVSQSEDDRADDVKDSEVIGVTRLLAILVQITRELAGRSGGWAIVGLLGLVLLAAVLPWGTLQSEVNRDDWLAPAKMTAVALPAYATPMLAMSQLGMMFQHANSPGAAFVLLVLGTGANLATLIWFGKTFGGRSVGIWLGSLLLIVVGIAYAINKPLFPPGVEPFDHTHAFDIYTNPVHNLDTLSSRLITDKLKKDIDIGEAVALSAMALLVVLGLLFRAFGLDVAKLESWNASAGKDAGRVGSFDRNVGPQAVGATMLVGLIALSIVMCYAFYPSAEESLEEIKVARAETLSAANSGNAEHAMFWIPIWDEWSRRLEVGTLIRRGELRPYQRMQGYLIRKKLEALEHELAHDPVDIEATRALVSDLLKTNTRWVRSYRDQDRSPHETRLNQSINTQEDVEHQHRHVHADGVAHDHEHDDFEGAHSHPHDHGHRHADAPHGGQIVAIGHTTHQKGEQLFHAEVMPISDGTITFHLLTETSEGAWTEFPIPTAEIDGLISRTENEEDQPVAVTFVAQHENNSATFKASIPDSLSAAGGFRVAVSKVALGEGTHNFEFIVRKD